MAELEFARRHPAARRVIRDRAERLRAIGARGDARADSKRLILNALFAAEYECLTGDTRFRGILLNGCRKVANGWPNELSRHDQIYALLDLCRTASFAPCCRPILEPVFEQALREMEASPPILFGTGIGKSQWVHYWCLLVLGRPEEAAETALHGFGPVKGRTYYQWGIIQLLREAVDDAGLFRFDGTDIWYWGFNGHPAFVEVGWNLRERLPPDARERFDLVYTLPIRLLCAGGVHPRIGAARSSPKQYGFFSRSMRTWRTDDEIGRWARHAISLRGDPLTVEDLMVAPADRGPLPPRPAIGSGNRTFGERLIIIDNGLVSGVIHNGDGAPLNGGHRTPGRFPQVQLIEAGRVRFLSGG